MEAATTQTIAIEVRPSVLPVNFSAIPQELKDIHHWVLWKLENRDGKWTKPPYQANGRHASSTDSSTWSTFKDIKTAYEAGGFDGVGFVLTEGLGIVGIDLDHCINDCQIESWAQNIIDQLDSYSEKSPSSKGLRVLARGNIPTDGNKKDNVEVYKNGRYLTITGNTISDKPIEDRNDEIIELYGIYFGNTTERKEKEEITHKKCELTEELAVRFTDIIDKDINFNEKFFKAAPKRERSDREFYLCCYLYEHGFKSDEIYTLITEISPQQKWKERGEKYRWAVISKAIRKVDSLNSAEKEIDLSEVGRLNLQVEMALESMKAYNNPPSMFKRSGELCRIEEVEQDKYIINKIDKGALRLILSKSVRWCRDKYKDVHPPAPVVDAIYGDKHWPVPWLSGITNTPVIRDDGSIFDEPGFDEETGYYYIPDRKFNLPDIADMPTQDDAKKAASYLMTELFCDFPFKDEASKANALAGLITPIARPIIDGQVPLCIISKPARGTGASLIAKIYYIVGTGREPKFLNELHSEEEWQKTIFSCLYNGDLINVFDNVDSDLKSSSLAQMLTSPNVAGRILGKSDMRSVPNRACWYATGNQMHVTGDLGRRSFLTELDAKMAQPWTRDPAKFRHPNLLMWTANNRGKIVAAILTMIKAWIIAGKPEAPTRPMGSFEEWTYVIGGILHYAGTNKFRENDNILYDVMDTGDTTWTMFLQAARDNWEDVEFTAKDMLDWIKDVSSGGSRSEIELPEEIEEILSKQRPSARSLGKKLEKKEGRTFDNGLVLTRKKGARNLMYYKIEKRENQTLF